MKRGPVVAGLLRFGIASVLTLVLVLAPDIAEARPKKKTVASKSAKKAHGKAAKLTKSSGKKRALSFGAPQTLMAEPQPQEPGESGLRGVASFYGKGFQGRKSASGERFDHRKMTAASNRFPLGTWLAVRRLDGELCVVVKVNDRMHAKHRVRIIDLSRGAAERLKMISAGLVLVRAVPLSGPPESDDETTCLAAFAPKPVVPEVEVVEPVKLPETQPQVIPLVQPVEEGKRVEPESPEERVIP